jgi:hypothetical protein
MRRPVLVPVVRPVLRNILRRTLILCGAVLCTTALWTSQASAVSITLGGADGQVVFLGGQVTVTMTIDTEATTGITLLSIAALFDDSLLTYNQAASSTGTGSGYILYDAGAKGGGGYLSAASTCGGGFGSPTVGAGCQLALPGQVNVDYVSKDLSNGTGAGNVGVALLATLVFDVTGAGGFASIFLYQTCPGDPFPLPGCTSTTGTLLGGISGGAGGVNIVPEPTTALLVGMGLAGLGIAGRGK